MPAALTSLSRAAVSKLGDKPHHRASLAGGDVKPSGERWIGTGVSRRCPLAPLNAHPGTIPCHGETSEQGEHSSSPQVFPIQLIPFEQFSNSC